MKSGIYMIINLDNFKVYIGSTKNLVRRQKEHFTELRKGEHHNKYLQDSYNIHGKEKFFFITLEECAEDILIKREIHWILLKDSLKGKKGYNLCLPKEEGGYTLVESQNKKVLGFHKITGDLVLTYNCVADITNSRDIYTIIDNPKRTYKGLLLVREENYDPTKTYTKINKGREPYIPKGPYAGKPVETYDLETLETIKPYQNKKEVAEEYGSTPKQVGKALCGENKSFRGVGVRYTV